MALDRTGTPDASDSDGGPQPAVPGPDKPAYGDESRGDPTSFGEQATTLMPPLPPTPAPPQMPKPPTPEEEEATARSNKRLTWVLSGAVVLVGILLFSVLGNSSDSSAGPVVQAPLDTAAAQASDLPSTSAAPPTTSALPTTSVAPPPPPPPPTTSVYVPPPPPKTTYRPTPRTTAPRTTRTTPRTTRSEPKTTRRTSSNDDDDRRESSNSRRDSNPYDYPSDSGSSRGLGL